MILAAVVASGQHLRQTAFPVQQRLTSLYASISISVGGHNDNDDSG